jgi:uncharacterized protein (DUF302 family)
VNTNVEEEQIMGYDKNAGNNPVLTNFSNTHVVLSSAKSFEKAVKDLQAELGKSSTEMLMTKLSASKTFEEFSAEIEPLAGRSNLIEVGFLDWGKVMSRVPIAMKAQLFIVGNPLTAKKLLEAGGPEVGLYLPTKIFIYVDNQGITKVAYDKIAPVMEQYQNERLNTVAQAIDEALAKLANAAAL